MSTRRTLLFVVTGACLLLGFAHLKTHLHSAAKQDVLLVKNGTDTKKYVSTKARPTPRISITVGDVHDIVAPAGSATAGTKWLEATVTYTNTWDHPVWINGYSEVQPFHSLETRSSAGGVWVDYGLRFCGTGARDMRIDPGSAHSFKAALPERFASQEFRVLLPYRMAAADSQWTNAASVAHRLVVSGAE